MNAAFFSCGVSRSVPRGSGGSDRLGQVRTSAHVAPVTTVTASPKRAQWERHNQWTGGPKVALAGFTTSSRLRHLQMQEEVVAIAVFDVVRGGLDLVGPRVGRAVAVLECDEFVLAVGPFPILRALGHRDANLHRDAAFFRNEHQIDR